MSWQHYLSEIAKELAKWLVRRLVAFACFAIFRYSTCYPTYQAKLSIGAHIFLRSVLACSHHEYTHM